MFFMWGTHKKYTDECILWPPWEAWHSPNRWAATPLCRFIPKGTIERKEFLNRVHLFTGISRSLLEGAMASFMDELRDCLADGWTVEFGELGYFTPSLNCRREVMERKNCVPLRWRSAAWIFVWVRNFIKNWIKRYGWNAIRSRRPSPVFHAASVRRATFPVAWWILAAGTALYQPCTVCPSDGAQREAGGHGSEPVYWGRVADKVWSGEECGVYEGDAEINFRYSLY